MNFDMADLLQFAQMLDDPLTSPGPTTRNRGLYLGSPLRMASLPRKKMKKTSKSKSKSKKAAKKGIAKKGSKSRVKRHKK